MLKPKHATHSRLPSVSKRIVAVETDGYSARAALVRRDGKQGLVIEALTQSEVADPLLAAREALRELRSMDLRMPRQAIVITAEVTPALLSLPIAPKERPPEQLKKALRWEIEPWVAQRIGSHQLGGILVGLNVVDPERIEQALKIQEERSYQFSEQHDPPRLGELLEEMGWVTRDQVEEALELQQWFTAEDTDITCGWSAIENGDSVSGNKGSRHPWLVAGLSRERRKRWREMLQSMGLTLEGVYPLAGSANSILSDPSVEACACIQLERGFIAHSTMKEGKPEALEIRYLAEKTPTPVDSLEFLATQNLHRAWVCGRGTEAFAREISTLNGCEASLLQAGHDEISGDVPAASLIPLVGASRHALGLAPKQSNLCVPPRDPGLPFYRHFIFWAAVTLVLTAAACLFTHYMVKDYCADKEAAMEQAQLQVEQITQAKIAHDGAKARFEELSQTIREESERRDLINAMIQYRTNDLPRREAFLPGLLDAISASAGEDVFLDRIHEKAPYQVEIMGWASSDPAAQQFYERLSRAVAPLGLDLLEQSTSSQPGRIGIEAYKMQLLVGDESEVRK